MADEYDFQINDLKFRAAISDKHPYQRATAPFRKEQFDSAPTVGDQSLTGWWTRGQLSFHKGAGLKYYEVLEGEEVLNRYRSGDSVNPFTPGRVTLSPAVTEVPGIGAATDIRSLAGLPGSDTVAAWAGASGALSLNGTAVTNAFGPPQPNLLVADAQNFYAGAYDSGAGSNPAQVLKFSSGGGATSKIYEGPELLTGLWFAKDRLWATGAGGSVYAMATSPATPPVVLGASHTVFTISDASSDDVWAFTSGPGPVFLGVKNRIYRVTPNDSDGSIPVMTAGVVVGELASNESIRAMRYLLGHVVVATTKGIRIALTDVDGSITLGPLVVEGVARGRSVGAVGSCVYALVENIPLEDAGVRLVKLDLGAVSPDLRAPWASSAVGDLNYDATTKAGVASAMGGAVVWGTTSGSDAVANLYDSGSTLAATGELTTAFHRFGTLEWKHFSSVRMRVAGSGGTVTAYLVEQDGTETLLGAVDAATATGADVAFSTGATEAIGLRFVLARSAIDATVGPEFLGYQIKAMPVPERQRLMRWPLLITDTYRTRYGKERGKAGGAYTALSTLEALESSNAVVTFTDHRTGETGSAYIEGIEFESNTPSSHNTTGFGGVAQLTLRVLS